MSKQSDEAFYAWLNTQSSGPPTHKDCWKGAIEWQKAQDADRSIESASELYQQGYEQGIAWQKARNLAAVEAARPAQHNASSSAAAVNAWFIQQEMCDEIKRRISEE